MKHIIVKRLLANGKYEKFLCNPESLDRETQCWNLEAFEFNKDLDCLTVVMTDDRTTGHNNGH